MLATEKIAGAFLAICEEAEKLHQEALPESAQATIRTIISIAKHQSDIRGAKEGSCTGHEH